MKWGELWGCFKGGIENALVYYEFRTRIDCTSSRVFSFLAWGKEGSRKCKN